MDAAGLPDDLQRIAAAAVPHYEAMAAYRLVDAGGA
jgi:hypothetical protein